MSAPLPRFYRELNMRVVRLTEAEKTVATARFDQLVAEAEARGKLAGCGAFELHKQLYARAHYGADASCLVSDGSLLDPLPAAL